MSEMLVLMVLLFAAYLFMPATWFSKALAMEKLETISIKPNENAAFLPEDSVLKRHFITQLRSEIEREMYPRPIDPALRRLHDTMIDEALENRLAALTGSDQSVAVALV